MTSVFTRNFYKTVLSLLLVFVMAATLALSAFAATEREPKVTSTAGYEAAICFDAGGRQFTGTYSDVRQKYVLGNESLGLYVMSLEGKNYYAGANGVPLYSDDAIFGNTEEEKARDYAKGVKMFRTLETIRRYMSRVYKVDADAYLIGLYNDAYDR